MAKRKSPQELMAARNPLTRSSVMPVDIYSHAQPPAVLPEAERERERYTDAQVKKRVAEREAGKNPEVKKPKDESDPIVPYSTYLNPEKIKKIKWRALERDLKDYRIVQEAIDEYFERNPTA